MPFAPPKTIRHDFLPGGPPASVLLDGTDSVQADAEVAKRICQVTANGEFLGTGWFAGPRTVITAAHCVDSTLTGRASTVTIIPNGEKGELRSTIIYISERWKRYRDDDYDYAIIQLDSKADAVTEKTRWFEMASLDDPTLNNAAMTICGYPSKKTGAWIGYGKIEVTTKRIQYHVNTTPGESGAPIYIHGVGGAADKVVGIHVRGGPTANEGIRITGAVLQELNGWMKDPPELQPAAPVDPCQEDAGEHDCALLIGVGDYAAFDPSGGADLAGSHLDAQAWREVCDNWHFAPGNVHVLTSPARSADTAAPPSRPAPRQNIQEEITWLKEKLRHKGSRGILVYSGHGYWREDKGFLLCPSDIDTGLDQAIPLSELSDLSSNLTLVLDCGFSGASDATKKAKVLPVRVHQDASSAPTDPAARVALHSPQVVDRVFVASAPGEPAYEAMLDGRAQGALTWALTGVLGTWGSWWKRTWPTRAKERTDLAFHACDRAREALDRQSIRQCPLLLAPWCSPDEQTDATKTMCLYKIAIDPWETILDIVAIGDLSAYLPSSVYSDNTEYWMKECVSALYSAATAPDRTTITITARAADQRNPASDYKAWHPQFQGRPCFTASTTPKWNSTTNARLSDSRMLYDSVRMVGLLVETDASGNYTMNWYRHSADVLTADKYALTTDGLMLTKLSADQVKGLPASGWYHCWSTLNAGSVP